MEYSEKNHTFIICAYQENPYLENCILSILNQEVLGKVMISTSTPNQYILGLAEKYDIPIVVNPEDISAVNNWNFAYMQANTELVTICHQDDYYKSDYLKMTLQAVNKSESMILLYTDYFEDRNGTIVDGNLLLKIKRILNFPLRFKYLQKIKWIRRGILSIGNPICCPSVMFHKKALLAPPFDTTLESSIDWKSWVNLSRLNGEFIYCPKKLMAHRIWPESLTSKTVENQIREKEDYQILCSMWPRPIAKMIFLIYKQSQNSNDKGE